MRFFYLLIILIVSNHCLAQVSKLQIADEAYHNFDYKKAIPLYLDFLDKKDNSKAVIKLAECYRKTNKWKEAEYWYAKVVEQSDVKPIYMLYYAKALYANHKCKLAKEWLEKYKETEPNENRSYTPIRWECDTVTFHQNHCSSCYELNTVPVNTKQDECSPVLYREGLLFVTFLEKEDQIIRGDSWTDHPFLQPFYTEIDTLDQLSHEYLYDRKPVKIIQMSTKYHDGPIAFSKDFSKIILTRNNYFSQDDESVTRLKIFTAEVKEKKIVNLTGLPFNSDEYSVAHGTFGKGDRMYFSSDMPGGFGGMDLYYTDYENEQWGPLINLGPKVNTEKHDVFPFYHEATDKLYFASDGHAGFGALDIYYTQLSDHLYSKPVNLGQPINSNQDDFSMHWNETGDFGFLTSNRAGGKGGDDIYSIRKEAAQVVVTIKDKATSEPIEDVKVKIKGETLSLHSDKNGQIKLDLPFDDCIIVEIEHYAYEPICTQICTKRTKYKQTVEVAVEINKKK